MAVIVIAVGLEREMLSPDYPYRESRSNVGRREIERLMGRGKAYGNGPLPAFLREVVASESADLIVLTRQPEEVDSGDAAGARGTEPWRLVDPFATTALGARRMPAPPAGIPWDALAREIEAGREGSGDGDPRVLVVGCHTEGRALNVALYVKSVLRCPSVAVCSHLVASATAEAHYATLRHNLPVAGIRVMLDLGEAADFCGLDPALFASFARAPCAIDPEDARDSLDDSQRRIVQLLCMHWTRARVRPLAGGFSGSLLLLAEGRKGDAKTEPMVLKIDDFSAMRRELTGYHQVKDFFGKNVPTFGYPVSAAERTGVGMDLAAMEGSPETLQDTFERADDERGLTRFVTRFEKALQLLSEKLYGNTRSSSSVVPYRSFGLHAEQQVLWFRENATLILAYLDEDGSDAPRVNLDQIEKLLRLVASNEDSVESEVCLTHGDLNLANVICDEGDNIWFIDWTHSDLAPIEMDFAKLENDAKFVMAKDFDVEELPRLRRLNEYLLSTGRPADPSSLPDDLKFVKWDLRYRKIYETVRRIREACFDLKLQDEEWLVYRVALLRYALHTLSFDMRRNRGECDLPQLVHALYSVEALVFDLVADDFHLKIRSDRPASYPARLRISIDEAPWMFECEGYDPPYHVDPEVLQNDRSSVPGGWADPEDFDAVRDDPRWEEVRFRDESGRPLNPRGRTGIAGRGELGLWGPNLSVAGVITRGGGSPGHVEILLGRSDDGAAPELPKGFVRAEEAPEDALRRVVESETGWRTGQLRPTVVFEGATYDRRQTDHAWVESRASLFHVDADHVPTSLEPGGAFEEVQWWPLDAETVNRVPSSQAKFIRGAVEALVERDELDSEIAFLLLARTG